MTVTIFDGNGSAIILTSKDKRFVNTYGEIYAIPVPKVYEGLSEIASWANNKLGEECLFEVD